MQIDTQPTQTKRHILIGIALVLLLSIISISVVVVSRASLPKGGTQASEGTIFPKNIFGSTHITWDTYSHPEGFSIDTPRGWTASELIEGQTTILIWQSPDTSSTVSLLLFPADLALDMETPVEMPSVSTITVDGIETQKLAGSAGNSSVVYVGPLIRGNQGIMFSSTSTTADAGVVLDRMTSSFMSFR